jgi:beta-lactam-binding protein with PASTA domain
MIVSHIILFTVACFVFVFTVKSANADSTEEPFLIGFSVDQAKKCLDKNKLLLKDPDSRPKPDVPMNQLA